MQVLNLIQGTPEWQAARTNHNCASEAPAAVGVSNNLKRNELIRMKATGAQQEFSDWVQRNILDKGHEVEALARPIAEKIIGDELFPATIADDDGYLLASLDGMTMDDRVFFEHKQWNAETSAAVNAGRCPDYHYWQVVQGFAINPSAEKCLFMCSDGTEENCAWMWVERNEDDIRKLRAAWRQFDADVADYQHVEVIPAATATPQIALPAVAVKVSGAIAITDNLASFGKALTTYVDQINKKPATDQDFADLEATVKVLKTAEEALDAAESSALAQTESIDLMRRTVAQYREIARTNRLVIEKLVKAEKENRRAAIVKSGTDRLAEHVAALNKRLGGSYMPSIVGDFAGSVRGLKSIASIQNAVDTELANRKIEASEIADKIETNLKRYGELATGYEFLFRDLSTLVLQPAEAFEAMAQNRVNTHVEAEKKREQEQRERIAAEERAKAERAAEADRARIRAEEEAKARAEQERIAREQREAEARRQAEEDKRRRDEEAQRTADIQAKQQPAPAPAQTLGEVLHAAAPAPIAQLIAPEPPVDNGAMLKLGEISARLGFALTADFLASLGVHPAKVEKTSKQYRECDFPSICAELIAHVAKVAESHRLPKAA